MKSSQISKLGGQLPQAESSLRAKLLHILPGAVEHGNDYFMNSEFNPFDIRVPAGRDELLQAARDCLAIREQLEVDAEGSVGALFFAACQ
jgi:hypothetical protein